MIERTARVQGALLLAASASSEPRDFQSGVAWTRSSPVQRPALLPNSTCVCPACSSASGCNNPLPLHSKRCPGTGLINPQMMRAQPRKRMSYPPTLPPIPPTNSPGPRAPSTRPRKPRNHQRHLHTPRSSPHSPPPSPTSSAPGSASSPHPGMCAPPKQGGGRLLPMTTAGAAGEPPARSKSRPPILPRPAARSAGPTNNTGNASSASETTKANSRERSRR